MKKPQLYLETSTWNFYYADDAPEKKEATLQFFEKVALGAYDIYFSEIVLQEFARSRPEKAQQLVNLVEKYEPNELDASVDAVELAKRYIRDGVIPEKKFEDAMHAAIATVNQMDALVSWNLEHLANFNKMERINAVNMSEGYTKLLVLITPMEVANAGS